MFFLSANFALIFSINGPNPAGLFSFFSVDKYSTNTNDVRIDGVLGTRTRGSRKVGADKSTELCAAPAFASIFYFLSFFDWRPIVIILIDGTIDRFMIRRKRSKEEDEDDDNQAKDFKPTISVTRLGDLSDFGQLFKAFGNN